MQSSADLETFGAALLAAVTPWGVDWPEKAMCNPVVLRGDLLWHLAGRQPHSVAVTGLQVVRRVGLAELTQVWTEVAEDARQLACQAGR